MSSLTRYHDYPACTSFLIGYPSFDFSNLSTLNFRVLSRWLTEKVSALCIIDSQISSYKPFPANLPPQTWGTIFTLTNRVERPRCTYWSSPPMLWVHSTKQSQQVSALIAIVRSDPPMFVSPHVLSRPMSLTLIWRLVRYRKGSVYLIYWPCKHDVAVPCALSLLTRYQDWPTCSSFLIRHPSFVCSSSTTLNSRIISGWLTEKVSTLCIIDSQINSYKPFSLNLLPQTRGTTLRPLTNFQGNCERFCQGS